MLKVPSSLPVRSVLFLVTTFLCFVYGVPWIQNFGFCLQRSHNYQKFHLFSFEYVFPITYHLISSIPFARVIGAPQMISQPVSSIFPSSPLYSGTWQPPGLSIPWCCNPTSIIYHLSPITKPPGLLRFLYNQFPPLFSVLHCPLGLCKLRACPFPDVVREWTGLELARSQQHQGMACFSY